MAINRISLRRKQWVLLDGFERGAEPLPPALVATSIKNLTSLGYTFAKPLLDEALTLSRAAFVEFYQSIWQELIALLRMHMSFRPFYPNFPAQVMAMTEGELYLNAFVHYISLRRPDYKAELREPISQSEFDNLKLKQIELGTMADVESMTRNIAASAVAISQQDGEDFQQLASLLGQRVFDLLPQSFTHRENQAIVIAALLESEKARSQRAHFQSQSWDYAKRHLRTATDVLRLIAALFSGDASLAKPARIGKLSRITRKELLSLLESMHLDEDFCPLARTLAARGRAIASG
jgi:hypothetical protein